MILLFQIIFWFSFIALAHTYIIYPLLLKLLGLFAAPHIKTETEKKNTEFPVSILIAAYNEEKVMKAKLESIFNSDYPSEKIEILVGSDASTDKTNEIIRSFARVTLVEFKTRSGKVKIINQLTALAKHDILLLTDANVLFERNTIAELVKHFNDTEVALVDSNMININNQKGIAKAESTYIRGEAGIKSLEGKIFGKMMGPFGGCYAMRKSRYVNVPENFLVDDFYINMKVLEKGGKAISEINAKVYEQVPSDWKIEFRRKIRIATGSFQNLKAFSHLLLKMNTLSFCFLSHKVLRWLGPFIMIALYLSNLFILLNGAAVEISSITSSQINGFYLFFLLQNLLPLLFLTDLLLRLIGIRFSLARLATHFLSTNLALLIGFIKFTSGVKSGIWNPTKR